MFCGSSTSRRRCRATCVVEGVTGGLPEKLVRVVELAFELAAGPEDLLLRRLQDLAMRRRTVSGRMASWYLPRLKVSRIRSATDQMKEVIWEWVI